MSMPVTETEFFYPSSNGTSQIRALLWEPKTLDESSLKGIIQIAHGMAEHSERYRDFAHFLVGEGYVVCANDHIAHGKSVASTDEWGCLPVKGGMDILLADVHQLRTLVADYYPAKLPFVVFGHSMGSFVMRAYCARHGNGLAGAILSGAGQQPAALVWLGNTISRLISAFKGADYQSSLIDNLGVGSYSKSQRTPRTSADWLSYNTDNVDSYLADPAFGFMFSTGGYATLTELIGFCVSRRCANNTPKNLPILFISGEDDPVGNKGKGVQQAADKLKKAGAENIDLVLYKNMRHEILNETNRQQVYQDVLKWLVDRVSL